MHQDLKKYKAEQKGIASTSLLLDEKSWEDLKSMQEIEQLLSGVGAEPCPDLATLKASSETWMQSKVSVQHIVGLVSSAVAGLSRARQTVEKEREAREKKEKARAEKAAAQAVKEAERKSQGRAAPKKGAVATQWAIRHISLEHHPPIVEIDEVEFADYTRPWLMRQSSLVAELMNTAPAKLNFLVFKTGFSREVTPFEQRSLKGAEAVRNRFVKEMGPMQLLLEDGAAGVDDIATKVTECLFWGLRGGCERVSAAQNGLGTLLAVASERASYDVLLVQTGLGSG